ncbi:Guanine nucleotide-binding protein negative regulator [Lachnellula hyalina]|uniref:Guanine nucleotide-binding protein negative regulator n=1 Tax=Lachnellula hyalina TaxID=1316788 RepID=A0A8H8TVB3_9HELO|nr:Guanine nucleotide-binding protein negative regulator [Lachnellula hyalina]TVY23679.1 Guanine nucleotide-binding protein negative regulator [Lachnellula hyalina]
MEPKTPKIVASTGHTYCCSIAESRIRQESLCTPVLPTPASSHLQLAVEAREEDAEQNFFKCAQWTPDGTSILTSSADNSVRTFVVPSDLLSSTSPKTLTPYTTHLHPTSINCVAPYPHFTLTEPSTTLYLSTPNSLPTRLLNALYPSTTPTATYPLISPTTEAYYTPASLLWSSPSTFLAGTDCLIALFDVERNGQGPVTRLPTIPSKRHKMKGGGVGMRGIVSALGMQGEDAGMLAAGTWTRWVGLYDANGMGGTVAQWSVAEAADQHAGVEEEGSRRRCGRYLCVVERKSGGLLVYDVRVTGKVVAWLEGREAWTNQRLGVDIFEGEGGLEVWAGGN